MTGRDPLFSGSGRRGAQLGHTGPLSKRAAEREGNDDRTAELRGCGRTSARGLRKETGKGRKRKRKRFFFHFLKKVITQNSNTGLNSTTKNRCSSMYATVNSYISLI
jgi:hypothetical protein